MKDPVYAGTLTASEFEEAIQKKRGVAVVCGSCEQHGSHLPLDTDITIGMEIALRVARQADLLVMPPVCFGQVWSAKGFPGTISLKPSTLKLLLREIVISLEEQNAPNIILLTGHNGNYGVLKELARELLDEFGWKNIWHFPLVWPKQALAMLRTPKALVPHAGELETALMLYLRPELTDLSKAAQEYPQPPEEHLYRPIHWREYARAGSFGDCSLATADLGEALAEGAARDMAELICKLL